jgi:hypothetical protein
MPSYKGRVGATLTCLARLFPADTPQVSSLWQWRQYQLPIRDRATVKGIEVQHGT